MRKNKRSAELFEAARTRLSGGVNSPVRAFNAVGGHPIFIERGKGSTLIDADGQRLLDYVLSWGALLVGHAHPEVIKAVSAAARKGLGFGAPTSGETQLAERIHRLFPSMERMRLTSSGTEAVMSTIRLARGFTQRDKILKFEGCYHGHADALLVKAGSGATTFGVPDSAGVPSDVARHTLTVPFGRLDLIQKMAEEMAREIACIIVEPVPGNMGTILPPPEFLVGLRELTRRYDLLLVFDEVISGFSVGPGGAQHRYGVSPDLTCLGKVIGGGLPVGAYGGREDIMKFVSPSGPVYQAGTLSGNPVAMAAGMATLDLLGKPGAYDTLEAHAATLQDGLKEAARTARIPVQINRAGAQMTLFFSDRPVTDYTSALQSDRTRYAKFFWGMIAGGVYFPPSAYEAFFISTAHTHADIQKTIRVAATVLQHLH